MRYAELHCKTSFSFLEGASHADELVARAAELGYAALAVTDRNSLAGVVRAHGAAKDAGLKLLIGAEITPLDAPPVVLWATDRDAYGRLSRLITRGRRRAEKGQCELMLEDIAEHHEGLLAGVVVGQQRGQEPFSGGAVTNAKPTDRKKAPDPFFVYREIFDDRAYLLAELLRGPDDGQRLDKLIRLSQDARLPLVAAGDVHYHVPERMALHDVLTAIRHGTTVAAAAEKGVRTLLPERPVPKKGAGAFCRNGPQGATHKRLLTPFSAPFFGLFPNAQRHLQLREEIAATFSRVPEAMRRTIEIADRCTFSLDQLRYEYPEELAPRGMTPMEYLSMLTWKGARKRYPEAIPDKVQQLLQHELALIEELRYEAYFLTVWDLVRFARRRGILCQGRGSAANSAVCYCLGITAVDPARADLLFERFVSRERDEAPDIDVDFEHERREEVLQYLYEKYGRERAGLAAEVITYRCRSAVRDVGKALGLSLDCVDALAKQVEGYHHEPLLDERCRQVGIDPASQTGKRLIYLVNQLIGFPRHLSQHVGGMVITQGPLCELVPIENAAMPDRTVIQWDKNDLDELGILKVDCLALGMLTAIRKCFDLVNGVKKGSGTFFRNGPEDEKGVRHLLPEQPATNLRSVPGFAQKVPDPFFIPFSRPLSLATIPPEDAHVYDMICRADTMGVFQIESRAQMSMLPRLRPRCYYDLVIEVAIVRPGPIQGQMVHPYLRRRMGEEEVTYPNDEIRQVLQKTLGVPIFQEQAMRLAVVAAGFTPGQADQLRRAMGAWRRPGVIDQFRQQLLEGMQTRGLSQQFAEQVFRQIRGFGEYGFPESHAASFALLVYVSAWLKHYYPAAFAAALINSQPMGFYAPAQLVRDAREHGVEVRPVDVNHSCWDCTLEGPALRLGFRMLVGFSEAHGHAIERARTKGSGLVFQETMSPDPFVTFASMEDFARRTRLSRAVIKRLAAADAFASLGRDRRSALWEALLPGQEQERDHRSLPLFDQLPPEDDPQVALPQMPPLEQVFADYATTGLSLRAHPISFYRPQLDRWHVTAAERLATTRNGQAVRVAGLVILRQRPSTAKGITFVTLEDETGIANLVVRQPIWQRYYQIARRAPAWIAHGRLECKHSVIHVVVNRLEDLSVRLHELNASSRDFR